MPLWRNASSPFAPAQISENAEKLQLGEVSVMPEGLVKISSSLYNTVLPLVEKQIDAQINLRNIEHISATIEPSEFGSWHAARQQLMSEEKKALKMRVGVELAAAGDRSDEEIAHMKLGYQKMERDLEHEVDHKIRDFSASINMDYNFLSA